MTVAVADTRPSGEIPIACWINGAARIALWTAIFLLILYPLLMVVAAAFAPPLLNDQPLGLADLLTERLFTASLNTFRLGLGVSVLSLSIGSAAALLAAQTHRDGWIDGIMSIPFLTPPFLAALAWSMAVGPKGYLSDFRLPGGALESAIFSFWGMSLIMAAHYAPLVYFAVRAQILKVPTSLLWAAQISGATCGRIIGRILFPITLPALLAGGFLAFASGIEEYGTPLVVGNRIGFPVISTEIGRLVSVYPINLTLASALASILLALAGGVYFASYLLQHHSKTSSKASAHPMPDLLPPLARTALWSLIVIYAALAVAIPYGSIFLTSLLKLVSAGPSFGNLTGENYLLVLKGDSNALRDALMASLALALFAAALGTILGSGAARDGAIMASLGLIPVCTPAITMAVGFIRGWNAPWTAWLPVYGSAWIVGLYYSGKFLPFAVHYARAGLAAMPSSYEWAARVHGATSGNTMRRIVAPLLWPHCLAGAILIFSISFRELVGSVLLRPPGMQTVATFILREFDQGSPATGMAMGMIAILVALLSVFLARFLGLRAHRVAPEVCQSTGGEIEAAATQVER
jgi:iron(III) transport system permease protein